MTRKLDFIVFGMPRGGTSAVGRYLSAVKEIHCAQEVVPVNGNHAILDVPDCLLASTGKNWRSSSVADVTARRDTSRYYGNKRPQYFYRLNGVLEELDNCPAIACVRNPRSVALSYSTRSLNPKDNWHAGRRGLFAVGDALMLVHALHHAPRDARIMILPQKALLADWRATMTRAIAHIAPSIPADFNPAALEEIDKIKNRQTSRSKVDLEKIETRALNRIEQIGLFDLFDRDATFMLDEVRDDLARIVADGPGHPIGFITRLAGEHPDPLARAFAERWSNPAKRAWKQFKAASTGV